MKKLGLILVFFISSASFGALCMYLFNSSLFTTPKIVVQAPKIATPLPQHESILFVSNKTGNQEIYMMDLTTKTVHNLTQDPSDDMNPQVTRDGRYIVFYSDRDKDNEIYKMDLETNETTQLTNNKTEDYDPTFSPDGKYIIYKSTEDDTGDIFIMNSDGLNKQNLTKILNKTEEWNPAFSYDGSKILFVQRRNHDHLKDEIFMMNSDGTNINQITTNDVPDWYVSVNQMNGKVAFVSKSAKTATDNIFTMTEDGKSRTRLTKIPGNDGDPSWDKTGKRIVFINDIDGDYDIFVMNSDGSNIEKVLDTKYDELSPIFLPIAK